MIEPNVSMIKRGNLRAKKSNVSIRVCEAGTKIMPFKENAFDYIVAALVFCSIPNPYKALKEVRCVSKPGAKLVF